MQVDRGLKEVQWFDQLGSSSVVGIAADLLAGLAEDLSVESWVGKVLVVEA